MPRDSSALSVCILFEENVFIFNFWMMKFTVMFCFLCILSFKNWKINTLSSKNIQTEKAEESLILTEQEEAKTRYFPPQCTFCEFNTYRRKNLYNHVKIVHEKYKPNKCDKCFASFHYKRDLDNHMARQHPGVLDDS